MHTARGGGRVAAVLATSGRRLQRLALCRAWRTGTALAAGGLDWLLAAWRRRLLGCWCGPAPGGYGGRGQRAPTWGPRPALRCLLAAAREVGGLAARQEAPAHTTRQHLDAADVLAPCMSRSAKAQVNAPPAGRLNAC